MTSTIISCIHSALDDIELLVKAECPFFGDNITFKILRFMLRNLRTFVLSTRKLGDDGSLGSFLGRIEDTVRRKADEIHPHRLCPVVTGTLWTCTCNFEKDIRSLEKEIDEWYVTMLDNTRQSSSPTTDEVLELISSILENPVDFEIFNMSFVGHEILREAIEALGKQMTFLKSLIHFATQRSVEPREDLLAHIEAVAINAAYLLFTCKARMLEEYYDEDRSKVIQSKISTLLRKIRPIDPHVCEIYTQALTSSKLSRQLLAPTQDKDDDALVAVKNLLEYFISNLWEMLRLNTSRVVSMKDQLQELYGGLRSLRTILKDQPDNFDMKIKEDIGVVVCDAGVLICSFYQTNIEANLGLQDFLETIKIILAKVGKKDPEVPIVCFPRINELGFVDFLLEKLMELTSCEAEPTAKSRLQTIQEELVFLRSFLWEIMELRNEKEELQVLWDRVIQVAYRVECLIDHLVVGDLLNSFSTSFDSITKNIGYVKADVLKIFHGKRREIEVKEVTRTYSPMPSQRTLTITNEVVGFDNEARSIMDRLIPRSGQEKLQIVAIVGMPGLGKTTLAAKVYDDRSVLSYFNVRAWCPISQVVDRKKVLLDLLSQTDPNRCSSEMTEQDLAEKLRRSLKRRRYLIVLDDIWEIKAWITLKESFPDDVCGSRIILTSRRHDMVDQKPHLLSPLNEEESMSLLQRRLFPKNGWPLALRDLGMQIVQKCQGLPLSIIIVAGLLATTEPKGWKEILNGLGSGIVSSTERCQETLELSYKHLPDYLKPCFIYFGAFSEDQEVSVRRLFRLWIAEGFVRKDEEKSRECVAEDYLKDLIGRSLIIVSKQRYDGGVKLCRIHDLLHDFCLRKAKDEHFFHFLKGCDELLAFNEPCNLRRLWIDSEPKHFKESKLFCPHARSLLFNFSQNTEVKFRAETLLDVSFVIHIFKLLRVLNLEQIYLHSGFPSEIEQLVQLAFLAIRGEMSHIPSSIGNLSNLETFIVNAGDFMLSLPDSLWNLQKLKHLHIRSDPYDAGGCLPMESPDSSSVLYELDWFSGAIIPSWGSMERLMKKFPRIRKLKCKLFQYKDDTEKIDKIAVPDFLSQLESLHMSHHHRLLHYTVEFSFPVNLKKLTLSKLYLHEGNLSTIGQLPNLEVLKLVDIFLKEETWEMKEGEFSKLRILKLSSGTFKRWRACDDQFVYFQKLLLHSCRYLEEMPSCLESIETLEMIEVSYCSETVVNLVRHIGKKQAEWGNSGLKSLLLNHSNDL